MLFSLFFSCTKNKDENIQHQSSPLKSKFFKLPINAPSYLQRIADVIKSQDDKFNFVETFIKKQGLPIWDKAVVSTEHLSPNIFRLNSTNTREGIPDTVAIIPIVLPDTYVVHSFFVCFIHETDVKIALYRGDNYQSYSNSEELDKITSTSVAAAIMYLDKLVFGYDKFIVTDTSIFSFRDVEPDESLRRYVKFEPIAPNNSLLPGNMGFIELCLTIGVSGNREDVGLRTTVSSFGGVFCISTFWTEDPEDINIFIDVTGPGGGSSWTGDPCEGQRTIDGQDIPCNNGGPLGWEPVQEEIMNLLQTMLNLSLEEKNWLNEHPEISSNLYDYLTSSPTSQIVKKDLARQHLEKMMSDPDYLSFVEHHLATTTNKDKIWWEDDSWLNDPDNFNIDVDQQGDYSQDNLNPQEKNLVKKFPIQAYYIHKNAKKAIEETQFLFSHQGLNDKSDAFRHGYFSALNERDCGKDENQISIAEQFGNAHESTTPLPLALEKQMDLINNSIGFVIGSSYMFPAFTSDQTVENDVLTKFNNGEFKYIKPLNILLSPLYDGNQDGQQDCPTCLNGILPNSVLTPTNQ
jgi:hypothetical protein